MKLGQALSYVCFRSTSHSVSMTKHVWGRGVGFGVFSHNMENQFYLGLKCFSCFLGNDTANLSSVSELI